jgi:hypothetical protein
MDTIICTEPQDCIIRLGASIFGIDSDWDILVGNSILINVPLGIFANSQFELFSIVWVILVQH